MGTLRNARFQSTFGLILGIISWVLPAGVVFALGAIIFGLIGLYRNFENNRSITVASIIAIISGASARFIYALTTNTGKEFSIIIALVATFLTLLIIYKTRHRSTFLK